MYGIGDLAKADQFREYFIPGVEYTIDDLDWPSKYHPEDAIWVGWLGTWVDPATVDPDSLEDREEAIALQLFEQVINYGDPVPDPETTYAQGAKVGNVVSEILAGADQPPLYVVFSPVQYYAEQSFLQVYEELTTASVVGDTVYKIWDDLTKSEQVRAILDYLGYEKLFDVQFLSGFKKTVYVDEPANFTCVTSVWDLVHGMSQSELLASGASLVNNASFVGVGDIGPGGEPATYCAERGDAQRSDDGVRRRYGFRPRRVHGECLRALAPVRVGQRPGLGGHRAVHGQL